MFGSNWLLFLMLFTPVLVFGIGDLVLDVIIPYLRRR